MSSTDERLLQISRRMLEQTRAGAITWKTTDDEDTFLYSASNSSVLVTSWNDSDGDRNVRVTILNPRGTEVGSISSGWDEVENPDDPWKPGYKPQAHNKVLVELHEAARRNALRIDEVLDSLMMDLDDPSRS